MSRRMHEGCGTLELILTLIRFTQIIEILSLEDISNVSVMLTSFEYMFALGQASLFDALCVILKKTRSILTKSNLGPMIDLGGALIAQTFSPFSIVLMLVGFGMLLCGIHTSYGNMTQDEIRRAYWKFSQWAIL